MDIDPATEKTLSSKSDSLEFQTRLNRVMTRIHDDSALSDIMPDIMPDLMAMMEAERVTIYQRGRNDAEIVSRFKVEDELNEIRVPLSATSVAGYVALTQKTVVIDDIYNGEELKRIDPKLRFDRSFDQRSGFRTKSMVAVPIKYQQVLIGVLQLVNHSTGTPFDKTHVRNAMRLAQLLAQKLRYDLQSTRGPFHYLIQRNRLDSNQLERITRQAKGDNAEIIRLLREELLILPSEIGASLEHYYQVPYFPYDSNVEIPKELIAGLNEAYLREQRWVPVAGDREKVTILTDDPTDVSRIQEIQRVVPAESYVFMVGLPEDILRYLGQEVGGEDGVNIQDLVGRLHEEKEQSTEVAAPSEEPDENEATVVQLVNRLIQESYRAGASDIHIEPEKGNRPATVRVRVDGACRPLLEIPASHIRAVISRIKVMAQMDISERRKPQDGKLIVRFQGTPLELRVATIPTVNGEEAVLRILTTAEPLPLEKLSLTPSNLEALQKAVTKPHGIFLVVGPTGAGKTTTLHSILSYINTPERKIWTAEDPVEIAQRGLHQVQIHPKIGFTFASALRSFLRADPDVIMIGEMRDAETAQAGVEASLTGHMVFSTLHTNSAAETLVRLLDLDIDPINFADALIGVLAQRLVRTLCEECREAYQPDEQQLYTLRQHYGENHFAELGIVPENLTLYRAVGCPSCNQTGYRGRVAIQELLVSTPELQRLIYNRANAADLKTQALSDGMRTLRQDGVLKLLSGKIDFEQLFSAVGG
ncbi:MAG: GspE/PulE family protein [Pseudomonadota bacterium]